MRIKYLLLFTVLFLKVIAPDKPPELNTNWPDQSESDAVADIYFTPAHAYPDLFSQGIKPATVCNRETEGPICFYSVSLGTGITEKLRMFNGNHSLIKEAGREKNQPDKWLSFLLLPFSQLYIPESIGIQNSIGYFTGFDWPDGNETSIKYYS